jgi:CRISPR-associated protein Cas1
MLKFTERGEANYFETDWPERCRYWATKADSTPARKRRDRRTEPLIISGHGMLMKVDKGCLLINGGLTHYPAEKVTRRYFKGGLDLPPRIIAVDGSGTVSLDALDWISEQAMTFVRINFDGSHSIVMSPSGYSADAKKLSWQLETRESPKARLDYSIRLIALKLEAAIVTLRDHLPKTERQQKALNVSDDALVRIRKAKSVSELLGLEGTAAFAYWIAWRDLEMKWKALKRFPIPGEWTAFRARTSVLTGGEQQSRHAANPVNAMLNYAYAVLLSHMRIKAAADGYDPLVGILHDQRRKKKELTPSFALDLMEPLRPVVDRAILQMVRNETFSGADFQLQSDGVCRLNPELARDLVRRVANRDLD